MRVNFLVIDFYASRLLWYLMFKWLTFLGWAFFEKTFLQVEFLLLNLSQVDFSN
jgi:hypothetical protein